MEHWSTDSMCIDDFNDATSQNVKPVFGFQQLLTIRCVYGGFFVFRCEALGSAMLLKHVTQNNSIDSLKLKAVNVSFWLWACSYKQNCFVESDRAPIKHDVSQSTKHRRRLNRSALRDQPHCHWYPVQTLISDRCVSTQNSFWIPQNDATARFHIEVDELLWMFADDAFLSI